MRYFPKRRDTQVLFNCSFASLHSLYLPKRLYCTLSLFSPSGEKAWNMSIAFILLFMYRIQFLIMTPQFQLSLIDILPLPTTKGHNCVCHCHSQALLVHCECCNCNRCCSRPWGQAQQRSQVLQQQQSADCHNEQGQNEAETDGRITKIMHFLTFSTVKKVTTT